MNFIVKGIYAIKAQKILAQRSIHLCLSSARNLILKNFTTYWKQQKAMQKKGRVSKLTFPGTSSASWGSTRILWKVNSLVGLTFYLLMPRDLIKELSKSWLFPHVLTLSNGKSKFGGQLWFEGRAKSWLLRSKWARPVYVYLEYGDRRWNPCGLGSLAMPEYPERMYISILSEWYFSLAKLIWKCCQIN